MRSALVLPLVTAVVRGAVAQGPPDSLRADSAMRLPGVTVSVLRAPRPLERVAGAVAVADSPMVNRARPGWGLDEAVATAPGVYAANRYNFSLDQRTSIRGFGARSSFGIRGIKVTLDGIPQSLPDGTGQLTNLDLGAVARVEVLRGPSSALYGNASGGVIAITTDPTPPLGVVQQFRFVAGSFDRGQVPAFGGGDAQTWTRWQSGTVVRAGQGYAALNLSRMVYDGQRQHSAADQRRLGTRLILPLGDATVLSATLDVGDDPRADNPGALTAAELAANPDSAAAINIARDAGKAVTQAQGGVTLRRRLANSGEATLTLFALTRELENPQTFAWIGLSRRAGGARATVTLPGTLLGRPQRMTAGLDYQLQRDDRTNYGNNAGQPDTLRQLDQLEHVTEFGPFVQSALDLDDRTTLTAGLRYDRVTFEAEDRLVTATNPDDSGRRTMHAPSGSIGVTRRAGRHTFYATVGTSFETPTTTELTNRPDTAGGFNPALDPQRAVNIEVGVRGALGAGVTWSLATFIAPVKDALVAYQVPGSPGRVFYQNAGRSRNRGFELGVDATPAPWLRALLAWTWSDFRYTSYTAFGRTLDGRTVPGIPAHWIKLLAQLRPRPGRGPWAEVQLTYSSSVLVSDTLDTRAGDWFTADVRAGWDLAVGGVRLGPFAALQNVFDRNYVSSVVMNAANGRYYEPAPGRNGYLGLSIGAGR